MQKEQRIKLRVNEPKVWFGCGDDSFRTFTDDFGSGDG